MKAEGLLPEDTKGNAVTTVAGIELMHRIRKGQFCPNCPYLKDATMPTAWNLVLAARQGVLIWWR